MAVVSDNVPTIVADGSLENSFRHRISWSSIFVGAVVGTAVIFFLLTLGSGVGLSLVQAKGVASRGFLSLGAIYFLAAQAMGFAVGGHLVGRLIGPMAETDREEEFRAATHGLAVWGLCVSATAVLIVVSGWVAAGSGAIASDMAMAPSSSSVAPSPSVSAYWTDVLFRPASTPMHAALGWQRYAQAATTATDASPTADDESSAPRGGTTTQMTPVPSNGGKVENDVPQGAVTATTESAPPSSSPAPHVITIPTPEENAATSGATVDGSPMVMTSSARSLPADKTEVGRILETAIANGGALAVYDRDRIAELVSQDTGVSPAESARRIDNALSRIRADQTKLAESARKIARNASLWIALALLFGAIVTTMAAISARWEDDRITFGLPRGEAT